MSKQGRESGRFPHVLGWNPLRLSPEAVSMSVRTTVTSTFSMLPRERNCGISKPALLSQPRQRLLPAASSSALKTAGCIASDDWELQGGGILTRKNLSDFYSESRYDF